MNSRFEKLRRILRRWLGAVLIALALIIIVTRLDGSFGTVAIDIARVGFFPLLGAIAITMASLYFQARYHSLLLGRLTDTPVSTKRTVKAYLQSQIVRYLPGKIWGVVYQSQSMACHVRPVYVVLANILQTVLSGVLTAGLAFCVFAAAFYSPLWLAAIAAVLALVEWFHRYPAAEALLLGFLSRLAPRLKIPAGQQPQPLPWRGTAFLAAEWVTYLSSFVFLLQTVAKPIDAIVCGVWYATASLLAMTALVVPAGLAIREAIFLLLPESFGVSPSLLATTAVLLRVVQVCAELCLATGVSVLYKDQARG